MTTETLEKPATITTEINFGNGRYSSEMERIYNECQDLLGMTKEQAEKVARQASANAGDIFRNAKVKLNVGKANSDGRATISDASQVKGVILTPALSVVHALKWIGDAGKHGVGYRATKWQLDETLSKWIDSL